MKWYIKRNEAPCIIRSLLHIFFSSLWVLSYWLCLEGWGSCYTLCGAEMPVHDGWLWNKFPFHEGFFFLPQVPNFINATLPAHERITAQEIDSYFRQELIYKRNERMGRRVKDLLEEHPDKSFFFAFGAGMWLWCHSTEPTHPSHVL